MQKKYIDDFIRAGAIAKEVRAFGKSLIKKGASYNDVIAKINGKIVDLGAIPAFPPQMALNDVAAHFLPNPGEDLIFSEDLIKLDVGICYHGAIGDCAVTVDLTNKYHTLVEAVEAALLAAEKKVQVGVPIRLIGKTISDTLASYGFTPIKNLSGHGLGSYQIHLPPLIPNYDDRSPHLITPGMTFAIEPFGTNGAGRIYEAGNPMIFSFVKEKTLRSPFAQALLPKIKSFQGLPFAFHDLIGELAVNELNLGIAELLKAKVIAGYSPLIEEAHGMVAQAENSVLVDTDGKVLVTTR